MSAHAGERRGFRPDIEGLRAIAVSAVVLYHAHVPGFSGGYVGVDVFFVISGFLITGVLMREHESTGRIRISEFYARRARRLLPAASLVILVTLAGSLLFISPVLQRDTGQEALSATLFFSNIHFWQVTDYFRATRLPSPFLHFWSLSVEEQFYAVWPLLLLTVAARSRADWRRRAGYVIAALGVASFVWCVAATPDHTQFAFFWLPTRAWELAVGAGLALGASRIESVRSTSTRALLAAGGLVGVGVAVFRFSDATLFPGAWAAVPVIGTAAVIAAGTGGDAGAVQRLLALRPMQLVGRYSYSLYLWHWPALILASSRYPTVQTNWHKAILIVGVGAVPGAVASFHLIEDRARSAAAFRAPRVALLGGAVLLAVAVLGVVAFTTSAPERLDSGRPAQLLRTAELDPREATNFVPSNIRPTLREATVGRKGEVECDGIKGCWSGAGGDAPLIVLFGDSHAGHFDAAFAASGRALGFRVLRHSAGACGSFLSKPTGRTTPHCDAFRERVFDRIDSLRPRAVVLSNYSLPTYRGDKREWETGVRAALRRLPESTHIFVIGQTPEASEDVPACLAKHLHETKPCEPAWPSKAVDSLNRDLRQLVEDAGASFIDVNQWVCTRDRCPAVVGDILVYRDANHFTRQAVEALAPRFERILSALRDA